MPRFDTAALGDIPEDTPVKASAGETDLVLVREGDAVRAFTHACPHLGLPLSKGVVRDGTLICAFHHACFDTRTGQQAQPPGHGDLRRYDVTVEDGRVWVDVPDDEVAPHPLPVHARRGLDPRRFVVVGSGAAGEACALALREQGFEGQVEMISPETRAPYDRTALSKAVLAGGKSVDALTLEAADALAARDVTRIAGTASAIEGNFVVLEDGGRHAFDAVFLAPGGAPIRPDLPGADLPGVHTLRSAEDGQRIAGAAAGASKAVLVGGGFIGLEAALSLAKRGIDVTVVVRGAVPLAKVLGERIGRAIAAELEAKGVRVQTGANVARIEGTDRATGVALEDGTRREADLVLLAVGVCPATGAIEGLPREENGAVTVATDLSVPGLDGVFVGGDCAVAPTPFGPARIEHWRVARQHGIRAARAMLGKPAAPDDIPFFWTALGRQYRYVGHAEGWDDVFFDGDPAEAFLARYVKNGRIMAAVGAGRDADLARLHLDMKAAGGPLPA
ncbi:FAD-dependent oxidoreductase [uncultured Jannaschia sp.]|uniref:FAD-dependent oxidoreductase n=1 Tax=uncultured Jannaschia sp. TaxID=293347 RepID=UPI0026111079|nr:FAD-dependent oxidoreductase [uncultured Jannaschia sp.]